MEVSRVKYVMVTNFDSHWDRVGGRSYYTLSMMKEGLGIGSVVENTPTIFIKRKRGTGEIEGCWQGSTHTFSSSKDGRGRDTVRFRFDLQGRIDCPQEYQTYREGWYLIGVGQETPSTPSIEASIAPPFLSTLSSPKSWEEFEERSSWLLKLLGIHELHTFPSQRGKADGFFKLGDLVVIYDCTLESDFERPKKVQIYNYSRQLKGEYLEYEGGDVDIRDCRKQVWIITRGISRTLRKIDKVTVKEVSISDLVNAFRKRIMENLQEDEITNLLASLGG
jgi:hypothetical protein